MARARSSSVLALVAYPRAYSAVARFDRPRRPGPRPRSRPSGSRRWCRSWRGASPSPSSGNTSPPAEAKPAALGPSRRLRRHRTLPPARQGGSTHSKTLAAAGRPPFTPPRAPPASSPPAPSIPRVLPAPLRPAGWKCKTPPAALPGAFQDSKTPRTSWPRALQPVGAGGSAGAASGAAAFGGAADVTSRKNAAT